MAKIGGTEVDVGIGIEATAGTPVAPTIYPKWSDLSLQAISEKSMFNSARGIRLASSDSMIRRKYSQGSLGAVLNAEVAPYLYGLALGSVATGTVTDGTYTHTITTQNANASMKTATVVLEQGGEVTERYANVVANAVNLEVSDEYARVTTDLIGGFPDTSTLTESFTQETEFAYHNMTAKFGTSISNAGGQSPTPLKSFTLNINNNVLLDEAFLSGSNEPVAGGFCAGRLNVTGSYSLHFNGLTELNKYKNNTLNAMIVTFEGAVTGGGSTTEKVIFELGKLVLTSPPKEYNIDGLVVLNQEFELEYDSSDTDITVKVTNDTDGTDY